MLNDQPIEKERILEFIQSRGSVESKAHSADLLCTARCGHRDQIAETGNDQYARALRGYWAAATQGDENILLRLESNLNANIKQNLDGK